MPHCKQLPFSSWYSGPSTGKKKHGCYKFLCIHRGDKLTSDLRFKDFSMGAWRHLNREIQMRKPQSPSCNMDLHNTRPLPIKQQEILLCTDTYF